MAGDPGEAPTAATAPGGEGGASSLGAFEGRPAARIAQEAQTARTDFHRALEASPPRPGGRAAALQAFFVANAGRGLLPAGETSGVLSPNLRSEDP